MNTKNSALIRSGFFVLFLSVSFVLIIISHRNVVSAFEGEVVSAREMSIGSTTTTTFILVILFILSLFVVITPLVYLSLRPVRTWPGQTVIIVQLGFAASMLMGVAFLLMIPAAFDWVNLLGWVLFVGLTAISHLLMVYHEHMRGMLSVSATRIKNRDMFVRSLELDHDRAIASVQWVIWAALIFVASGVSGVLFSPANRQYSSAVLNAIYFSTTIIGIWAAIGVWFGMIAPMLDYTTFIRQVIRTIAIKPSNGEA